MVSSVHFCLILGSINGQNLQIEYAGPGDHGLPSDKVQLVSSECFSALALELASGDLGHASLQVWARSHTRKAPRKLLQK